MAQRVSGFAKISADLYQTPQHVIEDLLSVVRIAGPIYEPACGEGKICRALDDRGFEVFGTDVNDYGSPYQIGQCDFRNVALPRAARSIVTNPPYGKQSRLAVEFIEHALRLMEPASGQVWMLLPADFDHAISRRHLFADHPAFSHRVVLHNRIKWFDDPDRSGSPSVNHAWFGWNWQHTGRPQVLYAGKSKKERAA